MKRITIIALTSIISLSAVAGIAAADCKGGEEHGRGNFIFKKMDINGDGNITAEEMSKAQEVRFLETDVDGDGFVTKEEMKTQFEKVFSERMENTTEKQKKRMKKFEKRMNKRLEHMFDDEDENEDGKISLEESMSTKHSGFIERFDKNEDGSVSQEEFNTGKKGHGWFKSYEEVESTASEG